MFKSKKGFTLVEILVVITILVIITVTGFIGYTKYLSQSRDGVRIADMQKIASGLELYASEKLFYPVPDDFITVLSGSSELIKQGRVGDNVFEGIGAKSKLLDPLEKEEYNYSVFNNTFLIQSYLEGNRYINIVDSADAFSYENKVVATNGKGAIILNNDNSRLFDNLDLSVVDSNTYKLYLSGAKMIGEKNILLSGMLNQSDKTKKLDPSLILYLDMSTTLPDGRLKDFSQYENHGLVEGGVELKNENNLKFAYFDGVDDIVKSQNKEEGTLKGDTSEKITAIVRARLYERPIPSNYGTIFRRSTGSGNGWGLRLTPDLDEMGAFVSTGGNIKMIRYPISYGDWQTYIVSYDGSSVKAFAGSRLEGELSGAGNINYSLDYATIGGNYNSGSEQKVDIDFVKIYNRALSEDEIEFYLESDK